MNDNDEDYASQVSCQSPKQVPRIKKQTSEGIIIDIPDVTLKTNSKKDMLFPKVDSSITIRTDQGSNSTLSKAGSFVSSFLNKIGPSRLNQSGEGKFFMMGSNSSLFSKESAKKSRRRRRQALGRSISRYIEPIICGVVESKRNTITL